MVDVVDVDVVVVGDVVEVVGCCGALVTGVDETTEAGVLVVGGEVVGGEVDVEVGGGLVTIVAARIRLGIGVVGVVAEVCAGIRSVDDGPSFVRVVGVVEGGAGAGALVVGGEVT